MKKFVLWAILPLSLLGNVVSLSMVGYGYWAYHHFHRVVPSGASDRAIITDIIDVNKDGYKNSHLIANYDGGRIVIDDPRVVMPIKYQHPKIGDAIQVQVSETNLAGMKMIRFSLARDVVSGAGSAAP